MDTNFLTHIKAQLSLPENSGRFVEFFKVLQDMVTKQPIVVIPDEKPTFTISQKDGILAITVSSSFISGLGENKIVLEGKPCEDCTLDVSKSTKFVPTSADYDRLLNLGYYVFTRSESGFSIQYRRLDEEKMDISMINLIKRQNMDGNIVTMINTYLVNNGYKTYIEGEEWPEKSNNSTQIFTVVKHVVTEKLVEIEKIVKTEVPIYVDKIIVKEVPTDKIKEVYVCKHTSGPVTKQYVDPDEDIDDKVPPISKDESSENEETEENEENDEDESNQESDSAEKSKVIKGKFLDPPKNNIIKSGDYVYRRIRKAQGQTDLEAFARWDKKANKKVNLVENDLKIIKQLGWKVAKNWKEL